MTPVEEQMLATYEALRTGSLPGDWFGFERYRQMQRLEREWAALHSHPRPSGGES